MHGRFQFYEKMHVVVDAADLKCDASETAHNAAHVLMKSRTNFGVDHRQASFRAENDVKEKICICHILWVSVARKAGSLQFTTYRCGYVKVRNS